MNWETRIRPRVPHQWDKMWPQDSIGCFVAWLLNLGSVSTSKVIRHARPVLYQWAKLQPSSSTFWDNNHDFNYSGSSVYQGALSSLPHKFSLNPPSMRLVLREAGDSAEVPQWEKVDGLCLQGPEDCRWDAWADCPAARLSTLMWCLLIAAQSSCCKSL